MSRRTPLSQDRVVSAAVALADRDGIDAVSMRRLAKELGVEAMSLYNHVANKDAILDAMVDAVAAEIALPPDDVEWKDAMRLNALSARDVFVGHPWASSLWLARQSGGRAQLRRADWMLRTLRRGGLSSNVIYHAFHILEAYILGVTVQHLSLPYEDGELRDRAGDFLRRLPADEFPDFAEHVHAHLEPHEGESGFELGLDLILDGLDRLR